MKLCSRLYSIEIEFYFEKLKNRVEPLFGGRKGNVSTPSIVRWKARGRFLFVIIEIFLLSVTVETL